MRGSLDRKLKKKNHQVIQIYKSDVDFYMQNKQTNKYFFLVIMIIDTHSMKAGSYDINLFDTELKGC